MPDVSAGAGVLCWLVIRNVGTACYFLALQAEVGHVETSTTSCHAIKRKRSWSRAVFSNLQRKGLEKRFQIQKYITKPDRRQLAATLGLTDAQVSMKNEMKNIITYALIYIAQENLMHYE